MSGGIGVNRSRTVVRAAILIAIFIGIALAIYNAFIKDKTVIQVGHEAPDFVLTTLQGEPFQLSELRGKGVILNFWGRWCQPCEAEMPTLEKVYQDYKDQGITVIGLNIGETDVAVKPFVERYDLHFPIVLDLKKEITQLYGIGPIPTTYFIDQQGIVKKIVIGGPMSEQAITDNIKLIKPE